MASIGGPSSFCIYRDAAMPARLFGINDSEGEEEQVEVFGQPEHVFCRHQHHILTYVEDVVTQLLEHKEENPKVVTTKFFSDYFNSVKEGSHVLFREYSYVCATPHNRACFVKIFWKCFQNIGRKGDLLSVREYHSLLGLLCPDFPFPPVQKTARIILMDDALDCLISFSDFLYAFQLQFCFDEFLSKCAEMYKEMTQKPVAAPDMVVVPTSEDATPAAHRAEPLGCGGGAGADGVDAAQYFRTIMVTCDKMNKDAPSLGVLRHILSGAQRVTFYGFLMALAKSDMLNAHVGKLPNKSALHDVTDREMTSSASSRARASCFIANPGMPCAVPPASNPVESRTRKAVFNSKNNSATQSPSNEELAATTGQTADGNRLHQKTGVTRSGQANVSRGALPQPTSAGAGTKISSAGLTTASRQPRHAHTAARAARRRAKLPKVNAVASDNDSSTDDSDSSTN